jgi:hypothetical protein
MIASCCSLDRAHAGLRLGHTRERGDDSVLPTVGQRPLPGEVLRSWRR